MYQLVSCSRLFYPSLANVKGRRWIKVQRWFSFLKGLCTQRNFLSLYSLIGAILAISAIPSLAVPQNGRFPNHHHLVTQMMTSGARKGHEEVHEEVPFLPFALNYCALSCESILLLPPANATAENCPHFRSYCLNSFNIPVRS